MQNITCILPGTQYIIQLDNDYQKYLIREEHEQNSTERGDPEGAAIGEESSDRGWALYDVAREDADHQSGHGLPESGAACGMRSDIEAGDGWSSKAFWRQSCAASSHSLQGMRSGSWSASWKFERAGWMYSAAVAWAWSESCDDRIWGYLSWVQDRSSWQ